MKSSEKTRANIIFEQLKKNAEKAGIEIGQRTKARWKKADDPSSADHNVSYELQAAIAKIVEYLESDAGKRFLETKTDVDSPNKIKDLFDDAVAGINALIDDKIKGVAKNEGLKRTELKKEIYTQLIATVAAQYLAAKLTEDDVNQVAEKSDAVLVAQLHKDHERIECGGAGDCGPLSILGALNMASMAVSDPELQKVINSFKKNDHSAALALRKALLVYIQTPDNIDEEQKRSLLSVPDGVVSADGTGYDKNIMRIEYGQFEPEKKSYYYKDMRCYEEDLLKRTHWFSDAEMSFIAKMLNINIVLEVQGTMATTIQRKESQDEHPAGTIYLYNYQGAHYKAYPKIGESMIAQLETKPLPATKEPDRERSPSPILTPLEQQTEAFAQLVEGLKNTLMDEENGKKLDAAILSMFDKIKEEVQADTKLKKEVQSIIDLLEKVKIEPEKKREFSEVLKVHRQAQSLLDKVVPKTLALDSPIRVALQAYIRIPCDVMCVFLPIVVNQSIKKIEKDNEFAQLLGRLYKLANDAASQFPKDKNTALMAAVSTLRYVYSFGEVSDNQLEIPYKKDQHPNINQINDAQTALNNAIRDGEIKKDDPLCTIIQTAITCARQVVEKYNELHPVVAIKPTSATTQPKRVLSPPAPKKLDPKKLAELQSSNDYAQTLLTGLKNKSAQKPENIKKTLEEAYDLAMLALQDESAKPVAFAIGLTFDTKVKIPNKLYIEKASEKINALSLPADDPIKIALQTAVEAALVAVEVHEKLNPVVFTPILAPITSLGSSSSLSLLVPDENKNPGLIYLKPILDDTITSANNEKQAVAKMKDCRTMLEKLLFDNRDMEKEKIAALQNLFLEFSTGEISTKDFKEGFDYFLTNPEEDEPANLLSLLQAYEGIIFNYVDIIAQSRLTSSLPNLEKAFVIPKEMNNNPDLEKSGLLLDKFIATWDIIKKNIGSEYPVFAMWCEDLCKELNKFLAEDPEANDFHDIEELFNKVIKTSDIPPAVKAILEDNRDYITEALTRIQDSRTNAATLQSNDPKLTNRVFADFLNVYYGENGPSKEFRTIQDTKDPLSPITLHNRNKGDNYEPTPLVTFTPSIKPATAGVVPFADCKFSDIYAGAKAAFIVMNKFKAENPNAECSVDNPKLNSDADYKNFLQALYDANKSADGKYMMNEVKINFTDANIRQKFIDILSGTIDVGLNTKVVAALKDNFGPPKTFEYTGTRMPRPPRATKTVQLKTQGIFTDADYQPKPAATVTAPTTAVTSTRPTSSSL